MSRLEMIRASLLAMLAASLLAFDLSVVCGGTSTNLADSFRVLAVLQVELAFLLLGVVFWPQRFWLRLILGGFALALVWLAVTKLVDANWLFQSSLLTRLSIALLMVTSFSLPCAAIFVLFRMRTGNRLSLFRRRLEDAAQVQFGIRHLFFFTCCFAVVAFAARAVFPASLAGQFTLSFDWQEITTLSLLNLFPGLASGPLALAVMRPTWHIIWIVPWMLILGAAELFLVPWLDSTALPAQSAGEILEVAWLWGGAYSDLAVALVVVFGLARIGGLGIQNTTTATHGVNR